MPRKTRKLTNEEKEIVLNLLDTKTRKEIAETIKVDYSSLKLFLDEQRIPIKKQGIPFEYYEKIFELYKSGLTLQTIHNDYFPQYTTDQINYICREAKITRKNGRQAILNHNYFSIIDTPNKAYWLGFLTADGSIIWNKNTVAISFSLSSEDKYILDLFLKDVESNLSVRTYKRTDGFMKKGHNYREESKIALHSKIMAHDLEKLNVIPNKSLLLSEIPKINENLLKHYIRGFFDGNGSITHNLSKDKKTQRPEVIFYSTESFCNSLKSVLNTQLNLIEPKTTNQKETKISLITYSGYNKVISLYEYLYSNMDDDCHYLKRKKEKFEKYISEYRDKHTA